MQLLAMLYLFATFAPKGPNWLSYAIGEAGAALAELAIALATVNSLIVLGLWSVARSRRYAPGQPRRLVLIVIAATLLLPVFAALRSTQDATDAAARVVRVWELDAEGEYHSQPPEERRASRSVAPRTPTGGALATAER
jgi:hypothetical protein